MLGCGNVWVPLRHFGDAIAGVLLSALWDREYCRMMMGSQRLRYVLIWARTSGGSGLVSTGDTPSRVGDARVGTESVGGVMPIVRVVRRTSKSRGYVQPVMYSSLCADSYRSP